ncbi:uncharacterized protein LOC128371005 [Scomber japonicus]|uniref:uncharacterized protein LOC128371005 n=1 Tax=Scomber japonicus TaxID=13676 RepID=UPI0023057CC1|nr:uncharacterized protein LOC128371005 [Scomber japonicus]
MSVKISESEWKTALTSILEQLDDQQYKKMLFCFCFDKIPKSVQTSKSREEMPQTIIQILGVDESISATNEAMLLIPRMDSAVQDKLRPFVDKLSIKQEEETKESEWKTALTSILEELEEQQYKKMLCCSYFDKIPKSVKTGKSREEMPQTIIQYLGVDESISATNEAMDQIPRKDSAVQDKLRPFVNKLSIKCKGETKESEWKTALTSILEELDDQEYTKMLCSCFDKIPKRMKTGKSREEMPQTIIQYLGVDESISATNEAMLFIPRRDPAIQDKLRPFVDKLSIKCKEETKESEWKTALTSILEELDDQQYKKMLFCCCFDKIPKGVKTSKSREEMPQTIIQILGEDESISAINEAMLFIPRKDSAVQNKLRPFVDKLRIKQEEESKGPQRENLQRNLPAGGSVSAEETLRSVRTEFIDRVSKSNLDQLLNKLFDSGIINDGEMESMRIKPRADKAQDVIDTVRKKGNDPSSRFIAILCELDPNLSRQLKLRDD